MEDFKLFQKCFREYQQRFGLTGYKTYFKYRRLENNFAQVTVQQNSMVATVTLNSKLSNSSRPFKDIRRTAKHEAIHLLLSRLEHRASSRYTAEEEVYEAVEEIVFKLEGLIKDRSSK